MSISEQQEMSLVKLRFRNSRMSIKKYQLSFFNFSLSANKKHKKTFPRVFLY